jgi:hypothetical protein
LSPSALINVPVSGTSVENEPFTTDTPLATTGPFDP